MMADTTTYKVKMRPLAYCSLAAIGGAISVGIESILISIATLTVLLALLAMDKALLSNLRRSNFFKITLCTSTLLVVLLPVLSVKTSLLPVDGRLLQLFSIWGSVFLIAPLFVMFHKVKYLIDAGWEIRDDLKQ